MKKLSILVLTLALIFLLNGFSGVGVAQSITRHFRGGSITNPLLLPDGSESAPSLSYSAQQTLGLFRGATDVIRFASTGQGLFAPEGNATADLGSPATPWNAIHAYNIKAWNNFNAVDGLLSAPSFSFSNESNSGLFRNAAGDIRLAVLGVPRFEVSPTVTRINAPDGGAYLQTDNGRVIVNSASLQFHTSGVPQIILSRITSGVITIGDSDLTPEIRFNVSGAPTLSTCGDAALATGSSNTSGRVVGTTQTACTLTFSTSFLGNSADCFITNLTTEPQQGNVSAASSAAFTVSGLTAGDDFMYMCVGR